MGPATGALYLSSLDFFTIGVSVAGDKNDLYVCAPDIKLNRHICRNLPESFGASGKSSSQLGNQ